MPIGLIIALLCFRAFAWPGNAGALEAGIARIDITPRQVQDVPMSGYTDGYELLSAGLHDSLYARVLVLSDGQQQIALASLDLIGFNVDFTPGPGRLPRLLRSLGLNGWLLVSTHTHGGPKVLHLGQPYAADHSWPPAPYVTWVEDRVAAAVREALGGLQPVRLAVGSGSADLSFNRRLLHQDGRVEMIWGRGRQTDPEMLGPTDPEVGVIRIDDLDGTPLAVLFNYACHAVVLGGGNHLLTADFPGFAMAHVEEQFPGALAIFLQGAAGDLDPWIDVQNLFAPAQSQGEELGREVVRVTTQLANGENGLDPDAEIHWTPLLRSFRLIRDSQRAVATHFGVLRLGRRVAFASLPGEPFVELQLDLKARSPLPYTFLLGYTNGYVGYFPTLQAAREGGYGASYGATLHLEASAGESMVSASLEELRRSVWLEPPPDTLVSAASMALQAVLAPAVLRDLTGVDIDLSPLGGPERMPLMDMGDGTYRLESPSLQPQRSGRHELDIYATYSGGDHELYFSQLVTILPGTLLSVLAHELAPDWMITTSQHNAFAGIVDFAGVRAAAFEHVHSSTTSLGSFWTLDFRPDNPIDLVGYSHLRFLVHPGTASLATSPSLGLIVNKSSVDLRDQIDFDNDRWQEVTVALADLDSGDRLERIRLWGWMAGTLYIGQVALHTTAGDRMSTHIEETGYSAPHEAHLEQNYPNPFNSNTVIRYQMSTPGQVELSVHDLAGQRVCTLFNGHRKAGPHSLTWDGRDATGLGLATGIYLYRLRLGDVVETRKLLLLR